MRTIGGGPRATIDRQPVAVDRQPFRSAVGVRIGCLFQTVRRVEAQRAARLDGRAQDMEGAVLDIAGIDMADAAQGRHQLVERDRNVLSVWAAWTGGAHGNASKAATAIPWNAFILCPEVEEIEPVVGCDPAIMFEPRDVVG